MRASYAGVASLLAVVRPRLAKGDVVALSLTPPGHVDVALVDALAALALSVRRCGAELQVCAAGDELQRLAALTGLADVLAVGTCSAQPQRKAQPGEQLGAQEVVDVRDPSA